MGYYLQQESDFIKRTLIIISQYDELDLPKNKKFEVTLLLNCLVGLIILPQQEWYNKLPDEIIDSRKWGIGVEHISFIKKGENKSVKNVVKHIRNSVSHYNYRAFSNSKNKISELKFSDFTYDKIKTFESNIPLKKFRKFVDEFSKYVLKEMVGS